MSANKRIRKTSSKSSRATALGETAAPRPRNLKEKARELETHILRVEMDILATSRQAQEHRIKTRDLIPPTEGRRSKIPGGKRRLTYAQTAIKNRKFMIQAAEFAVTAVFLVGGCAWLYQWWASTQGGP